MLSESRILNYYIKIIKYNSAGLSRNYHVFQRKEKGTYDNITSLFYLENKSISQSRFLSSGSQKIVQLQPKLSKKETKNQKPSNDLFQSRASHSEVPKENTSKSKWKYLIGVLLGSVGGVVYYLTNQDSSNQVEDKESKNKYKRRPLKKIPQDINEIPEKVPYLLVGGGTASFSAFKSIKSNDPRAKVLMISEEDSYPYMRPPLSKEIWTNDPLPEHDKLSFVQWNGNRRSLYYEPPAYFTNVKDLADSEYGGLAVALGYKVTRVDPEAHTVTVVDEKKNEKIINYGKCLIATGVMPKNIEVFNKASDQVRENTILLRTLRDLEYLWHKLENAKTIVIVGGSFLGSELAVSLARKFRGTDKQLIQLFREKGNMSEVLPEYLSYWTSRLIATEGVDVYVESEINKATMKDGRVNLELKNGHNIDADVVIVGAGCTPRTEIAAASGLETNKQLGGFVVNPDLVARTDLYVAGDVACFYDPQLDLRRRSEHHDHAVASGRTAGTNMSTSNAYATPYTHRSMFWSDLGPRLGYEAIGLVDSSMPTVAVFAKRQQTSKAQAVPQSVNNESSEIQNDDFKKYSKGVLFYLNDERKIVGVLMWNLFNRMHIARQLLTQDVVYDDFNEVAKLFKLHEE